MLGKPLAAEAAKEGIAGFAAAPAEIEFGLAQRDPHQADELHLVILLERAVEEFVFPVRPAGNVEHPIRPLAAINRQHPAVVEQRCLSGKALRGGLGEFVLQSDA